MGTFSERATFDAIRRISAATFNGTYKPVGGPLTVNPAIIIFQNDSDQLVTVTDNPAYDAMDLQPNERVVFDLTTNHGLPKIFSFQIGTEFLAKGLVGAGNFNITIIYGA